MRNGIEKHFVRQLELHSHPQLLSYLFLFAPFLSPFLSCMQIELSERERGRKGEREASLHIPSDTSYIMHIVYRLSFIIHFRDFQHICFFGDLICLRVTKIVSCSIFTPHTLGEPNSLQSVWQAEGTQRWHRHTRRQRSMRHRMMRMRSAIAVRMWPQIAGFEKSSSH